MTKAELISFLEPFDDQLRIVCECQNNSSRHDFNAITYDFPARAQEAVVILIEDAAELD